MGWRPNMGVDLFLPWSLTYKEGPYQSLDTQQALEGQKVKTYKMGIVTLCRFSSGENSQIITASSST